jgi:hypothetical protein
VMSVLDQLTPEKRIDLPSPSMSFLSDQPELQC